MAQMRAGVESIRASIEPVGDAMTTPTDTASTARRQVHLETLETIGRGRHHRAAQFNNLIGHAAHDR